MSPSTKDQRLPFLRELYRLAAGQSRVAVDSINAASALGLTREDGNRIMRFLAEQGWIDVLTIGGRISLTHDGVLVAESAESTSSRTGGATVHIVGDVNAPVLVAGGAATQTVSSSDLQTAGALLALVKAAQPQLQLGAHQLSRLTDLLANLESQLGAQEPDETLVRRTAGLVGRIALGAAGSASFQGLRTVAELAAGWV